MIEEGAALRARREALGLTLDDVERRTRIPRRYLEALEEGRPQDIPAGPYRRAYLRAVEAVLGIESEPAPDADPAESRRTVPLWLVRIVSGTASAAVVGLVAWQILARQPAAPVEVVEPPPPPPDQHVHILLRENAHLVVRADGELLHDRVFAGRDQVDVVAHTRIEVDVPAVDVVDIRWNDESIRPQGLQDTPRRLVFVDDEDREGP